MPRKFDINEMPSSLTSVGGVAGGASNRQAILQGSVSSTTGVPNFLSIGTGLAVNLSATATNLIVCFAAGFNTTGALSYIGAVTTDTTSQWSGLTVSTTNYLYIDRNTSTGALTYSQVTTAPVYQAFAPSSPATNQHWFDTSTMTMKYWSGSVWTNVQRVFVGHAVTSGSAVTSVISYAIGDSISGRLNTFISGYQAGQSVNTSTLTTLTFSLTADATKEWDTVNSKFIAPQKGRYLVKLYTASGGTSPNALIYKNGASAATNNFYVYSSSFNNQIAHAALELNAGDYLEMKTQHALGSTATVTADMYIVRVG